MVKPETGFNSKRGFEMRLMAWRAPSISPYFTASDQGGGYSRAGRGIIENKHSTDVTSPLPPRCVCNSV